jgi:hypothetical protein
MELSKRYNADERQAALEELADLQEEVRTLQSSAKPATQVGGVGVDVPGWLQTLYDRIEELKKYLRSTQPDHLRQIIPEKDTETGL